ncbi:MAG: metal ABC transporter ATP-binding protein [Candidatus Ozemobacteraceae bacterium]
MKARSASIILENVGVTLDDVHILYDVCATIERGEVTAIIGPNGAGKTTLLAAILGHIPFTGSIRFPDASGNPHNPRLAYVPQTLAFDRGSPVTVLDFLSLDRQRRPTWFGIKPSVRAEAIAALSRLEAAHLLERPLGRLSGGEMQRVLLASALRRNPDLLLLDEPVSGVDVAGGHLFCDVLEQVRREQKLTLVMVSHDLSVVSEHATRVICLNRTVSCQGETPEVLTPENLFQIYGLHSGLYEHHPNKVEHSCDHHAHDSHETHE